MRLGSDLPKCIDRGALERENAPNQRKRFVWMDIDVRWPVTHSENPLTRKKTIVGKSLKGLWGFHTTVKDNLVAVT